MCNYTGNDFGASYPDACCIDGLLWDLDSNDEDGNLTCGGDRPCPKCETERYLIGNVDEYTGLEGMNGFSWSGAMAWEAAVQKAAIQNYQETVGAIKNAGPIEATDFSCRKAKDWDDTKDVIYLPEQSLALIAHLAPSK